MPLPGRRPPNWFGWRPENVPAREILTMIPAGATGTVLADGENVMLVGAGGATIVQAYSV